jgi:hypothetical protein
MPLLGAPPSHPAESGLLPIGLQNSREMDSFHRNKERERMNIPDQPEPIVELSAEQRVYIYNVSPWRFEQSLGSFGTKVIPALEESQCLKPGELNVAGPLVIEGLPVEWYPADGEAKAIYHRPMKNRGRQSRRPGLDFAVEVVGAGMMNHPSSNLLKFGVFISEQPAQSKPSGNASKEAHEAYQKWVKDVRAAENALREKCAHMCADANMEHARGRFGDVRNDQIYQAAHILNKTELDCPWLKDTAEGSDKIQCWSCQSVIGGKSFKCPKCGELQVTLEEFEAEKKRRRGGA